MPVSPGDRPADVPAAELVAAYEREAQRLRGLQRESERQTAVLTRNARRLAAAATAREVAETTMLEIKGLGMATAELTTPGSGTLTVLASLGLNDDAVDRIQAATLADELPAATAMRTNGPVALRPTAGPVAYPTGDGADRAGVAVAEILAWPLHDAAGGVIGALAVGLAPAVAPAPPEALLAALAQQTGLALGRALEVDRRHALERELAERHRLLTELTGLVPGTLYVFDLERRETVFVNHSIAEQLGYEDSAFDASADNAVFDLVHPEDMPVLVDHMAELRALADGVTRRVQYRFRHVDGSWRWYESRDAVLRRTGDGSGVEVIGVATEITDRKQAEDALQAAARQDRFRADLADAMRTHETPRDAQRVATQLLGRHLEASRVHYSALSDGATVARVEDGYLSGTPSIAGDHQLEPFGPAMVRELRAGRIIRVDDVDTDPRLSDGERAAVHALDVRAYVLVPLMRLGQPVAVLSVHQDVPRIWSAAEVALIEEAAERTQATVERGHALHALAEREARYRSLFSAIDEGYCLGEMITDAQGRAVDYRFLEVNPRFGEVTGLREATGHTARELVPDLEQHWIDTMGRVGLGGETVRYENQAQGLHRFFSVYAAPVEPIGGGRFIVVANDITARHEAERTLRESAVVARRGRARSELVASVMSELEAIDRMVPLATLLVETLVPRLADYALLEVPDRQAPVLAVAHRDPERRAVLRALREEHRTVAGEGSILRAAAGEPRLLSEVTPAALEALSGGEPAIAALLERLAPRSHIAVPVDVSGESGALLLGLSDPERPRYGPDELALASEIADRASVFFAHARVREDEHTIGVRLQRALLPEVLHADPAIQVAARYQTGSDVLYVGGDWYDTVGLPDGRIVLAVGDVVGHGLEAAASMSRLRIALAALAPDAGTPGALLSRLGEFAAGANGVEFATATCGFLDPQTGELRYASAGHPPALVISAAGAARWLDEGRSTPVGAAGFPDARPEAITHLEPGDLLIQFSDGLVERRREPIGTGLERLARVAGELVDRPVEEICERLLAAMTKRSVGEDDAVVLCLRFSPVTLSAFQRRLPAEASELAPARAAIRAWLERRREPDSLVQRLLLALGEALTNAIEHAYHDRPPGVIELTVEAEDETGLRVSVRDHGRWRDPASTPGRGHGSMVIRGLARDVTRESGPEGTLLRFRLDRHEGATG